MYTISPGQTKTLTSVFSPANSATPSVLGQLPTAVESTGVLVISALPTFVPPGSAPGTAPSAPAVTDPSFAWSVTCPATVAVGAQFNIVDSGTNVDGTVDSATYPVMVVAADDTIITSTFE
jgi:hypothetical protein